jgi:hypothetical protein
MKNLNAKYAKKNAKIAKGIKKSFAALCVNLRDLCG